MRAEKQDIISLVRQDFPILQQKNRGKSLVYFDSAASSQKPRQVIEAMSHFYACDYANIHRGIYELSERASLIYENVREQVRKFINAKTIEEIIFLRGTTEAINLVAESFGANWQAGDEVILSEMEHHANIVPWYKLKEKLGIELKVIPVTANGELDLSVYEKLFSARTKLVAVTHISNVLGTINPIKKMTAIAHQKNVPVLIDGAQAVAHVPVDVTDIDCDFYAFSGHKLYGPTGIGVLYGKKNHLDAMPPYQGGGSMIETVSFSKITYAKPPLKFEAGTQDIVGVIGLSAALSYVQVIGLNTIYAHDQKLLAYAQDQLNKIPGLRILGTAKEKIGIISFVIDHIHPHDIGTILDHEGIAIRAGHHCAMPLMERLQVPATIRISFGIFNTEKEIDQLIRALQLTKRVFN